MVHVPAKFQENTAMHFRVTVRKLNVTDRQTGVFQYFVTDRRTLKLNVTDRRTGVFQYFLSRAFGAVGDNKTPRDARAHRRRHGRLSTHQKYAFGGKPWKSPLMLVV